MSDATARAGAREDRAQHDDRVPAGAPPRAHFVDLVRLVMSVQMITGHAVSALLDERWRAGPVFEAWTFLRGLTAVGFLVASGLSFHLSAERGSARRRIDRALLLIAVGYVLHAPLGLVTGDAEAAVREAQMVDVLQCIGVTMLVLEAAWTLAPRRIALVCAVLAALAIALAPLAAAIDCEGSALRFACNYLSRSAGSLFPLLPWSGFVLAGVAAGALAMPDGSRTPGLRTAGRLAIAGASLLALCAAIDALVARPSDPLLYSAAPAFSLSRLGWVLLLAALLAAASHRVEALPRSVRTLASETLFLYVFHLLALHVAGIGIARVLGPTLSPLSAIAIAIALVGASAASALAWSRRRPPGR
jgi:uncharacterized membrane protein